MCEKDEYAITPFYLFYNTVSGALDSPIRNVIDRCQRAADNNNGIEQTDTSQKYRIHCINGTGKSGSLCKFSKNL